jgi:hypothetical protein
MATTAQARLRARRRRGQRRHSQPGTSGTLPGPTCPIDKDGISYIEYHSFHHDHDHYHNHLHLPTPWYVCMSCRPLPPPPNADTNISPPPPGSHQEAHHSPRKVRPRCTPCACRPPHAHRRPCICCGLVQARPPQEQACLVCQQD